MNSLSPYGVCSNVMGCGVPYPRSGHRSVRLHHYIIFRKTRHLFLLHLQLVCTSPLISEQYVLLLPSLYDIWGAFTPLLLHFNVRNRPHITVLVHTVVTLVGVLPNWPNTWVCHRLSNGRLLPLFVLIHSNLSINLMCRMIIQAPQRLQDAGYYKPWPIS